jgi:hypothetical protein
MSRIFQGDAALFILVKYKCLILKEVLYGFVGNHLLVKDVSTSLGAFHHLDNLSVSATIL